ncbi:MAG TPA: hypothetical protein VF919_15105, partial [Gemmatimonadales bacterium]
TTTAAAATATPTAGVPTPEPTSTAVGGACPSQITFLANGDAVDLDTGWTGQSHDNRVINNGLVTVNATSCTGSLATVSGPAQNAGGTAANNHRCTGDTSVQCTTDGDCTGLGTCAFFFGAPLPLSSGSVSVCVINQINGALTGTADIVSGDSANTAPLISRVFTGPTLANPCSVCGTGAFGTTSTCSTGPKAGLSCTVNGTSPLFGSTSFDCPPDPGANIAALNITLKLTTGLQTVTLAAANPLCTAPGFTTLSCFCDTCGDLGAAACMTNADCAAGVVCGGKRCVSGTNAGAACTTATECPPSNACGRPGNVTKPNDCSDATCTANTPPDTDSVNEGTCAGGPFEQFCNIERFRGCSSDANCTAPGDTCSFGKFRECYTDNGTIGNALEVQGAPDPFVAGVSHGTLGSFFCVGPTTSGSVNAVAGLPGLGRLTLPGTATLIP